MSAFWRVFLRFGVVGLLQGLFVVLLGALDGGWNFGFSAKVNMLLTLAIIAPPWFVLFGFFGCLARIFAPFVFQRGTYCAHARPLKKSWVHDLLEVDVQGLPRR